MTAKFYILPDAEAVSLRAGVLFVELSKIAIASKGRFTVALSGGATPLRLFELLSTKYNKDIQWDKTGIFWVDERCVAPDNKDSNFKASYDALISRIDIPSANVHRIMGEMAPENGAREYEEKLKKYFENSGFPAFDLVILGVGQDGHTASLFPESEALSERERIAVPVYVEKLHKWRITLTLPVLNNALSILFLVTGVKKAGILKEILENERKREKYPAGHIQPLQGDVKWLIDKEAAVGLRADLSEKTRFFNVR